MAIRALIFDFDGLIIDTESTELLAWEEVYLEHECELTPEAWGDCIGRPPGFFDPATHLASLTPVAIDPAQIGDAVRQKARAMAYEQPLLPGVSRWIADAGDLGLAIGIVSSSSRSWVESHLERLGIRDRFRHLVCREDTLLHKPDPAPYRQMAEALGVEPSEAIVLEDSPNGVAAAMAAGMWCIAVPGPVTRQLEFGPATKMIDSLDSLSVREMIASIKNEP
jgi:HAD superfamily hydrolase (TIGR01509 family)